MTPRTFGFRIAHIAIHCVRIAVFLPKIMKVRVQKNISRKAVIKNAALAMAGLPDICPLPHAGNTSSGCSLIEEMT
jgi:hypothetical protein